MPRRSSASKAPTSGKSGRFHTNVADSEQRFRTIYASESRVSLRRRKEQKQTLGRSFWCRSTLRPDCPGVNNDGGIERAQKNLRSKSIYPLPLRVRPVRRRSATKTRR